MTPHRCPSCVSWRGIGNSVPLTRCSSVRAFVDIDAANKRPLSPLPVGWERSCIACGSTTPNSAGRERCRQPAFDRTGDLLPVKPTLEFRRRVRAPADPRSWSPWLRPAVSLRGLGVDDSHEAICAIKQVTALVTSLRKRLENSDLFSDTQSRAASNTSATGFEPVLPP
jgi:hypothetical protein